jgi:hypothetical protein
MMTLLARRPLRFVSTPAQSLLCTAAVLANLVPAPVLAQCCGQAAAPAPVATQTYRLDFQTVYDEQQVTASVVTYETVYDTRNYTVSKPVWETQTTERRYTVQRPVWETSTREERFTVMKPVYETVIQDNSYNQVRDVVETSNREERFTVMKPVYETAMQQQVSVVRKPVYETAEREEAYTVAEPVTTLRTTYADRGGYVDQVTPMVAPGTTQLGYVQGGWAVHPVTGQPVWQPGGYGWTMTPGVVMQQVNRVYQPNVVAMQVPETTMVNRVVTRKVPVQTMRYVDEQVVQQVPVQTVRMVPEEQVRQVPVQTVRKVVERVENKVPVQVCRMVPEEQVRQVPVQVCKYVAEERVEPVSVQVYKIVTEQRTAQVPRVVEKRVPYTYTVRSPRQVVMRVPLDACGNPLPAQAVAPASATGAVVPATALTPAAAVAKPASPPQVSPTPTAPPSLAAPAADAGPQKTYSDKPAQTPKVEEGWKGSSLEHVEPGKSAGDAVPTPAGSVLAEKPADMNTSLKPIETIPTPSPLTKPPAATVAPPALDSRLRFDAPQTPAATPAAEQQGPAVEPALPTGSAKDVPAAGTSALPLRSIVPVGDRST